MADANWSPSVTPEPMPAIYRHCRDVYEHMLGQARASEVEGVRMMVWEGFLVALIKEQLGFSTPYYTNIRKELIRMGCIRQLRRGGGTSPSQWEMITPPTVTLFRTMAAPRTKQASRVDGLEGTVRDLTKRVDKVEGMIEQLLVFVNNKQPVQEVQE